MYVPYLTMVPAVVNFVATKGRDTYSGLISDLMCVKCRTLSFLLQTAEKDLDVSDAWHNKSNNKHHHVKSSTSPVTTSATYRSSSDSPRAAFKKWRKNNSVKSQNGAAVSVKPATNTSDEDMSLLKFLAINALDLSAPASDVLLKSRSSDWFQLSGHPDSLAPAGPGTVWKKRNNCSDDTERRVYEQLSDDCQIRDIVPRYYREVDYHGEKFIELQDLLHGFQDPYVMDIKMGTRTFLESEVTKTQPRADLYQKMVAINPTAPTPTEHHTQSVTKLRYMQFREEQSSSCSHGFRIEAMKCRGCPPVTDLKTVKSRDGVVGTLGMYLGAGDRDGKGQGGRVVKERMVERLKEMRGKIEVSEYFQRHEVIGSSVFMIYDDTKVGVWLIDFAKTNELPSGLLVNHRSDWKQGNHEEGLLYGFDKLINIMEGLESPKLPKRTNALSKILPTVSVKS